VKNGLNLRKRAKIVIKHRESADYEKKIKNLSFLRENDEDLRTFMR
jgi:hypothetical protein